MKDTQLGQWHMTMRIFNFKWYNIDSQIGCHQYDTKEMYAFTSALCEEYLTYFCYFPVMGQNSCRGIGTEVLGLLFGFISCKND